MGLEVTMMGVWGGVALGWVFAVGGGDRVRVHQDGRGGMRGGWNELGWVGIGESLTGTGCLFADPSQPQIGSHHFNGIQSVCFGIGMG